MNHSSRPVLSAAAAVVFFAVCVPQLRGQQIRNAERAARERMSAEAAASEEREMMLALTERYHRSGEQRDPRLAFAQIREDFVRLQIVNNDLAKAVAGAGQLDLKLVAKSASEIRKRAERLKDNLALPEAEAGEKSHAPQTPTDPVQLRAALLQLDKTILSFASELHAKGVRRFDAKSSTTLRRELEEIVALSGRVKKCSEKLEQAAR